MKRVRDSSTTALILGGTTVGVLLLHPVGMAVVADGRLVLEALAWSVPQAFRASMVPMAAAYGLLGAGAALAARGLTAAVADSGPTAVTPALRQTAWVCVACGRTVPVRAGRPANWLFIDRVPRQEEDDGTGSGLCPWCYAETVDRMLRTLAGAGIQTSREGRGKSGDSPATPRLRRKGRRILASPRFGDGARRFGSAERAAVGSVFRTDSE